MCGRFVTNFSAEELVAYLEDSVDARVRVEEAFVPVERYNAAPTHMLPVAVESGDDVVVRLMHWGLVPKWARDPAIGSKMINARVETVTEKPSFRGLVKAHRCVVPMRGFYEWKRPEHGPKEPFYVTRDDAQPMMVAGLWTESPILGNVCTFCTLTTESNGLLAEVHHRSPVILETDEVAEWLSGEDAIAVAMLAAHTTLSVIRVSTRVNSVRNDDSHLIEAVGSNKLFD